MNQDARPNFPEKPDLLWTCTQCKTVHSFMQGCPDREENLSISDWDLNHAAWLVTREMSKLSPTAILALGYVVGAAYKSNR